MYGKERSGFSADIYSKSRDKARTSATRRLLSHLEEEGANRAGPLALRVCGHSRLGNRIDRLIPVALRSRTKKKTFSTSLVFSTFSRREETPRGREFPRIFSRSANELHASLRVSRIHIEVNSYSWDSSQNRLE